jgi:hypothetical protein
MNVYGLDEHMDGVAAKVNETFADRHPGAFVTTPASDSPQLIGQADS